MDEKTVQFPEVSPPLDEYSDVESVDSEDPAEDRRKYQRGGRKKSKSRIDPLSEPHALSDDKTKEEEVKGEKATVCPECAARKKQQQIPDEVRAPFETGIKAFNLRRAEASGGRPIGVRTTTSGEKSQTEPEKKKKKKKKARKEESEDDSEEQEGEPERKPVSIRLDLNLVLEVFLKAKIQGDVTITFLE